ncbi:MAG: ComEC/Rec2 family competence protein [Planctomycetota bacterium]
MPLAPPPPPSWPRPCLAPAILWLAGALARRGLPVSGLWGIGALALTLWLLRPSWRSSVLAAALLGGALVETEHTRADFGQRLVRIRAIAEHRIPRRSGQCWLLTIREPHRYAGRKVLVEIQDDPKAAPGDLVEVLGVLSSLKAPTNPGESDPDSRWRAEGVVGRLRCEGAAAWRLVRRSPGLRNHITSLRSDLARSWRQQLSPATAGLAAALVLGDRSGLEPELRDRLQNAGAGHFLAVSGLHVGLLLALIRLAMGPRPGSGTRWLVAAVLVAYAAIAGGSPATLRATGAALLWLAAISQRRPVCAWNLLAALTLVTLLTTPMRLDSPGFQLSYCAVAGLIVRSDRRRRAPPGPRRRIMDWLGLSAAAWIGTLPIAAYHFGEIHPYSPFFSLLLLPVFTVALAVSFLAIPALIAGLLWMPVEAGLSICLAALRLLSGLASGLPAATFPVQAPSVWGVCGWLLCLAAYQRGARLRIIAPLAALTVLLWGWPTAMTTEATTDVTPRELELTVLDVGHGSTALIRSPAGATCLIDAGAAHRDHLAEQVLIPALEALGVARIDRLLLTHPDDDHTGAVRDLLAAGRVGSVIVSAYFGLEPSGARLLDWLRHRQVPIVIVGAGDTIRCQDLHLKVLHPASAAGRSQRSAIGPNDASLAVTISVGERRVLITGDQEEAGLALLTRRPPEAPHDVVLLPHHGNEAAGLEGFLRWSGARLAIASRSERFDLAASRRACQRLGISLRSTDRAGAMRISVDPRPRVQTYRSPPGNQ